MDVTNLVELISGVLAEKTYVSHDVDRFLETGENYGSIMLKLNIKLKDKSNGKEEILHCVAKTPPPRSWIWELFTTKVTFKKEVSFYEFISPNLEKFLKNKRLEFNTVPKCYGCRINDLKDESNEVDENAAILLENLKVKGYGTSDRFVGFDIDGAKLIIKTMAFNHAAIIAFRNENFEKFKAEMYPRIAIRYKKFLTEDGCKPLIKFYVEMIEPFGVDSGFYYERMVNNFFEDLRNWDTTENEQYNFDESKLNIYDTMIQNDMWTNNILVKSTEGKVTDVKVCDFQVTLYAAGSNDLVFFLYTSVQLQVLKESFNDLIKYYYDSFIGSLNEMNADISMYNFENFTDTVRPAIKRQFSHILLLLPPIFTKRGKAKELSEFSPEDFKPKKETLHENFPERLYFVINHCIENNFV